VSPAGLGIRYAAAARFAPPRLLVEHGPAGRFGPACPQAPRPDGATVPAAAWDLRAGVREDCLSLNVWSPRADARDLPVLFWIHGGSFLTGAGSQAWYDGAALAAAADAVVVTINYRLGLLGWVIEPNLGLRDVLAALAWVRGHIAAYGGDPARVTVAGHSAGAKAAIALLGSPLATPLFSQVLSLSGAFHADLAPRGAELRGYALEALGDAWDERHVVDVDTLVAAGARVVERANRWRWPASTLGPEIDGMWLREHPLDAVRAGALAGKRALVLSATTETRPQPVGPLDATAVARHLDLAPEVASALVDAYGPDAFDAIEADFHYGRDSTRLAVAGAAHGGTVFRGLADWPSPDPALGSAHGVEVALLFGSLDLPGMDRFTGSGPDAHAASARLQGQVAAFLHGDAPWPAYDGPDGPVHRIGSGVTVADEPSRWAVWDSLNI
jgi:para-nitrobenzyl esterase